MVPGWKTAQRAVVRRARLARTMPGIGSGCSYQNTLGRRSVYGAGDHCASALVSAYNRGKLSVGENNHEYRLHRNCGGRLWLPVPGWVDRGGDLDLDPERLIYWSATEVGMSYTMISGAVIAGLLCVIGLLVVSLIAVMVYFTRKARE